MIQIELCDAHIKTASRIHARLTANEEFFQTDRDMVLFYLNIIKTAVPVEDIPRTFENWKRQADMFMVDKHGLDEDRLPDWPYMNEYENGTTPAIAADRALLNAGYYS